MLKRILSLTVSVCFCLTSLGPVAYSADGALNLPAAGTMVNLSPAYTPVLIKGVKIHPDNPLLFDFILDSGESGLPVTGAAFRKESQKLIKYFLAAMTIKEDDLWVNLSPYEKDRTVPKELGQTGLGRDMLAQDYILKQLTASLIYPERDLGKKFWDRVYAQAQKQFGTANVPVNTFNKVWIVPDKAKVLQRNNTAFVIGAHLKVMLEEDYLALSKHQVPITTHSIASRIVKEIILPELEKEVNQDKNFAPLRQMFYSMILASWYKIAVKQALLNQVYANKDKINGVQSNDPEAKEKIYQRYLQAYKKGVFNYIKETEASNGMSVPRKYFSGGTNFAMLSKVDIVNNASVAEERAALGTAGSIAVARTEVERSGTVAGTLMKKVQQGIKLGSLVTALTAASHASTAAAQNTFTNLYPSSLPEINLFLSSTNTNSSLPGLTTTEQGAVPTADVNATAQYGADPRALAALGLIQLFNNNTTIIDTFVANYPPTSSANPLYNYNNGYTNAVGTALNGLPYDTDNINDNESGWYNNWDWTINTGAGADEINLAIEAYIKKGNSKYLTFAIKLATNLLPLQDTDGGFRYAPKGIYYPTGDDFFWNLKDTKNNEDIDTALQKLYSVTNNPAIGQAAANGQTYLENIYDSTNHLFPNSKQYINGQWVTSPLGATNEVFSTATTAEASTWMLTDTNFPVPGGNSTQSQRDAEIEKMFNATEIRTAFTNTAGSPIFFKTADSTNNFGEVKISSQMADAYLRAAQFYYATNNPTQYTYYIDRYKTLISSLKNNFLGPASENSSDLIAPDAQYVNPDGTSGGIAAEQQDGLGGTTQGYEASLASSTAFALALNGYDPGEINGGPGIPQVQPPVFSMQIIQNTFLNIPNAYLTITDPQGASAYDIYSTDSLTNPNWTKIANDVPIEGTGKTHYQDPRPMTTQRFYRVSINDQAMKATVVKLPAKQKQLNSSNPTDLGGIDLNSKNMRMDIYGQKINIKFDPAMIAQFKQGDFTGVYPMIINITPIASVMSFLNSSSV